MAAELSVIQSDLEQECKRLMEELDQLRSNDSDDQDQQRASSFNKTGEAADAVINMERRFVLEVHIKDSLAAVEHALSKISVGTYGICEDCGKPINPVRMEVVPHAVHCIDCSTAKLNRVYRL
ncbi:MAG: TraR/DksA C4-type zinc finger protein [Dehalococcoidales bacterium]|nr:TraR/DksA C4-type zinc finger protein [Dehalococcoidales bacterium]